VRALQTLLLAGTRLLVAIAFAVIVIALVVIYLAKRHQIQPGDLKGLRDRIAPNIVEVEHAAERLAHAAGAQTATAVAPSPASPQTTFSQTDAAPSKATNPIKNRQSRREAAHRSRRRSTH
jgi:hypothetical protein